MTDILVEERGRVAWVTLNRAEVRNALSRAVNLKLQDIAASFETRDDLHAVVLEPQPAAERLQRDFTNEFRDRLLAELAVHPAIY